MIRRALTTALLVLGGLSGCAVPPAPPTPGPGFTLQRFTDLPGWRDGHQAAAMPPLIADCARLALLPPDQVLGGTGDSATRAGRAGQWSQACAAARDVPPGDDAAARRFFEAQLQPWKVSDSGSSQLLFTGYFEPEVAGSRVRSRAYDVPLYAKPPDLVQLRGPHGQARYARLEDGRATPYWSRAEIDAGALRGRHLELLWLKDPVDLFMLQVQGAGRVRLPDGSVVRLAYAGKNGLPYVPIGRVVAARTGTDPAAMTWPLIRSWLEDHPAQIVPVLDKNPSYVFFRILRGTSPELGPPGTLGVPLTPGRSVAVDRAAIPLATPLWIDTTDPVDHTALRRLMLAQDLGAGITGALRTDIFFGWGPDAEARAGQARQPGSEWVLLPK